MYNIIITRMFPVGVDCFLLIISSSQNGIGGRASSWGWKECRVWMKKCIRSMINWFINKVVGWKGSSLSLDVCNRYFKGVVSSTCKFAFIFRLPSNQVFAYFYVTWWVYCQKILRNLLQEFNALMSFFILIVESSSPGIKLLLR